MKDNQLQIVSYSQAIRLKQLGFNWEKDLLFRPPFNNPKLGNWLMFLDPEKEDCVFAPTVALALKWCRDEKGIVNGVQPQGIVLNNHYYEAWWISKHGDNSLIKKTYEAAESSLLDEILKILGQQKWKQEN